MRSGRPDKPTGPERTRFGRDDARAGCGFRAALQTLGERLPPELLEWLSTRGGPEPFDIDEFLRRVACPGGLRHPARSVDDGEFFDVTVQRPQEYATLLPRP